MNDDPLGFLSPTTSDIQGKVTAAANKYGVPIGLALSVAKHENGFRPYGTSTAGAQGPMQVMPGTAAHMGIDPTNVDQNIDAGVHYLAQLHAQHGDWNTALQFYNGGVGSDGRPDGKSSGYASKVLNDAGVTNDHDPLDIPDHAASTPVNVNVGSTQSGEGTVKLNVPDYPADPGNNPLQSGQYYYVADKNGGPGVSFDNKGNPVGEGNWNLPNHALVPSDDKAKAFSASLAPSVEGPQAGNPSAGQYVGGTFESPGVAHYGGVGGASGSQFKSLSGTGLDAGDTYSDPKGGTWTVQDNGARTPFTPQQAQAILSQRPTLTSGQTTPIPKVLGGFPAGLEDSVGKLAGIPGQNDFSQALQYNNWLHAQDPANQNLFYGGTHFLGEVAPYAAASAALPQSGLPGVASDIGVNAVQGYANDPSNNPWIGAGVGAVTGGAVGGLARAGGGAANSFINKDNPYYGLSRADIKTALANGDLAKEYNIQLNGVQALENQHAIDKAFAGATPDQIKAYKNKVDSDTNSLDLQQSALEDQRVALQKQQVMYGQLDDQVPGVVNNALDDINNKLDTVNSSLDNIVKVRGLVNTPVVTPSPANKFGTALLSEAPAQIVGLGVDTVLSHMGLLNPYTALGSGIGAYGVNQLIKPAVMGALNRFSGSPAAAGEFMNPFAQNVQDIIQKNLDSGAWSANMPDSKLNFNQNFPDWTSYIPSTAAYMSAAPVTSLTGNIQSQPAPSSPPQLQIPSN